MQCPKCGSTDVSSNKIYGSAQDRQRASMAGHFAGHHGHPVIAAFVLVSRAVDHFLPPHKCGNCRNTFR